MSARTEVKTGRFYTPDHEWAQPTNAAARVGITAFAVDQLGDITLLDITVRPGDRVEPHQAFGTVESVKTLSDLFAPVAGTVVSVHEELLQHPEWLNEDPWDKAWMIELTPDKDLSASAHLMDPQAYRKLVEESDS